MIGRKMKAIHVEYDDGRIFNITDLEKVDYEAFLELTVKLNAAYQVLMREQKLKDSEKD